MAKAASMKRITTSTARKLEGLVSMHQDLRYVMQVTHMAVEVLSSQEVASEVYLQTLWSASVIAYARPFKDGVRQQRLDPLIFEGIEGAVESHEYFLNQRDKLVAHSVNPFEEVAVGVLIDPDGKVKGVGHLSGKLIAVTKEGFNDLNQLAKIGTDKLKVDIDATSEELQKEAEQMSTDQIGKLNSVRFTAPSAESAGEPRTTSPDASVS